MKQSDITLLNTLDRIFSRYIDDQHKTKPIHEKTDLFLELQGEFSEILDVEKNEDALLVQFLSVFIKARIDSGEDIIDLMKSIKSSINNLIEWQRK